MLSKENLFTLKLELLSTVYSVIRAGFIIPVLLATVLGAVLSKTILTILVITAFTCTFDHLFTLFYIKNTSIKIQKLGILLAVAIGLFLDFCLFCVGFSIVVPKYILIIVICALLFSIISIIRQYHNDNNKKIEKTT